MTTIAALKKRVEELDGGESAHYWRLVAWARRNARHFLWTCKDLTGDDAAAYWYLNLKDARAYVVAGEIGYRDPSRSTSALGRMHLPTWYDNANQGAASACIGLHLAMTRAWHSNAAPVPPASPFDVPPTSGELLSWIDAAMGAIEAGATPLWARRAEVSTPPRLEVDAMQWAFLYMDYASDDDMLAAVKANARRLTWLYHHSGLT